MTENVVVWKFWERCSFRSFGKFAQTAQNFPLNLHTKKLGETTVFSAMSVKHQEKVFARVQFKDIFEYRCYFVNKSISKLFETSLSGKLRLQIETLDRCLRNYFKICSI